MGKIKRSELQKIAIDMLEGRGVSLMSMAEMVMVIQIGYQSDLTIEQCLKAIRNVLRKREVVYAILTGVALDEMAEKKLLPEPLQSIIESDDALYGIDEIIPLSIVNLYGTIGLTNYGYLDKAKFGIIRELDEAKNGTVNTFLDDLVAGIVSAAASNLAHSKHE